MTRKTFYVISGILISSAIIMASCQNPAPENT